MFEFRPVSTNVIFQSWMSLRQQVDLLAAARCITKSLEAVSS